MRRVYLFLLATIVLGAPLAARADELDERQNPQEYEDSRDAQPLRIASYFMMPAGFLLEWTVVRPLHYLATETPLAPAFDSLKNDNREPLPIAELPTPDYLPVHDPIPKFHNTFSDTTLSSMPTHESEPLPTLEPVPSKAPTGETQPMALPPPAESGSQNYLH
jgi:hypothetical protein